MAFIDVMTQLSDSQEVTADIDSVDAYDASVSRDLGRGCPLALEINIEEDANNANGDEIYLVRLNVADDITFSDSKILIQGHLERDQMKAGTTHVVPLPPSPIKWRYLRARYDVGGTNPRVVLSSSIKPLHLCNTGGRDYFAPSGFTV